MAKALEIEGLKVDYKDFTLGDIDLSLDEGLFLGVVGPNGAGKTTLIKTILGITPPGSGSVKLFGKELGENEAWCKSQIGFVLGESRFWESLSAKELGSALSLFYKDWDGLEYASYLDRFEIPSGKKASKLSTGMKTRLYLATALSHHARLLVLDEPTAGLDPLVRHDLVSALGDYLEREGTSVIFSSHITSDLDKSADMLLFLLGGAARYYGSLDGFLSGHDRVRLDPARLDAEARSRLIGLRETEAVAEGISADRGYWAGRPETIVERASLEDIVVAVASEDKAERRRSRAGAAK